MEKNTKTRNRNAVEDGTKIANNKCDDLKKI
jgi:hypothetical protein